MGKKIHSHHLNHRSSSVGNPNNNQPHHAHGHNHLHPPLSSSSSSSPKVPQHLECINEHEGPCYRVTYRGVVALLSEDGRRKSGTYLSYGEIVSGMEVDHGGRIRVDRIWTGGYATTPTSPSVCVSPHTSSHSHSGTAAPSSSGSGSSPHFLLRRCAERVDPPVRCDVGRAMYRVTSTSPLAIVTGPCEDAPPTAAVALPGSIHEVGLRVQFSVDGPTYVKIHRRNGWLPDRRHKRTVLVEVSSSNTHGNSSLNGSMSGNSSHTKASAMPSSSSSSSTSSVASSSSVQSPSNRSVVSSISAASRATQRRKRLPRRLLMDQSLSLSVLVPPTAHASKEGEPTVISSITTSNVLDSSSLAVIPYSPNCKSIVSEDDTSFVTTTTRYYPPPSDDDDAATETHHSSSADGLSVPPSPQHSQTSHSHNRPRPPPAPPCHYLMRVHATMGLKILDAPHFQVNSLIHGQNSGNSSPNSSFSSSVSFLSKDARTRLLPHGTLFEASKRMESAGVYTPGAGLIKLSDQSGWAIVPHSEEPTVEEIGNAMPSSGSQWVRIFPRAGICVVSVCPSPLTEPPQPSLLDRFIAQPTTNTFNNVDGSSLAVLHCGACVEVDAWDPSTDPPPFARLKGNRGWIPRQIGGDLYSHPLNHPPRIVNGSFWYRVVRAIKVRRGPSRRAPSISSAESGQAVRFECGEFLRASRVLTIYGDGDGDGTEAVEVEVFCQLYRNHRKTHRSGNSGEWVQAHIHGKTYCEVCPHPPHMERHYEEGWTYRVVTETVRLRLGPSPHASPSGHVVRFGERVQVHERCRVPGDDHVTWLRLLDGRGWATDRDLPTTPHHQQIPHRPLLVLMNPDDGDHDHNHDHPHRKRDPDAGSTASVQAYHQMIARLFHNGTHDADDASPNKARDGVT